MGVNSGFLDTNILYAANLNTNFANCVNIAGDNLSGTYRLPILIANTSVSINGIDIGSGLAQAAANANAAFLRANTGAGAISNTQLTFIADTTHPGLTVNTGVNITLVGNNTLVLGANAGTTGQVGVVQLNDTTLSTSATLAATANSVNTVWGYAQSAFARANTIPGATQTTYLSSAANPGLTVNTGVSVTLAGNNTLILGANAATTGAVGVVQLNDTLVSTSTTQAGTANSVNAVYNFVQNVANTNTQKYAIPSTLGTAQWVLLGQYIPTTNTGVTVNQQGDHVIVDIVTSAGFNALISQDQESHVYFKTSNGTSNDVNGFCGDSHWYKIGNNSSVPNTIIWQGNAAGNAATIYSLYGFFATFTGNNSFYNVTVGGGSWKNVCGMNQVDPGTTGSNTICVATEQLYTTSPTYFQSGAAINLIDIGSGLAQAASNANAAFAEANSFQSVINSVFSVTNSTTNLVASAFNKANTLPGAQQTTYIANTSQPGLTVNNSVNVTLTGNNTLILGANAGTTGQVGVVQLNDTTISQSATLAATANSVNTAWSYAVAAFANANAALARTGGTLSGVLTSTQNVNATNFNATGSVNATSIMITPITSNTNYILSNRDNGNVVTFSNANTTLVNVNNTLSIGFRTILTQIGTGNVKVQAGANVTVNPVSGVNSQIASQWASASLFCYAANSFILDGNLI